MCISHVRLPQCNSIIQLNYIMFLRSRNRLWSSFFASQFVGHLVEWKLMLGPGSNQLKWLEKLLFQFSHYFNQRLSFLGVIPHSFHMSSSNFLHHCQQLCLCEEHGYDAWLPHSTSSLNLLQGIEFHNANATNRFGRTFPCADRLFKIISYTWRTSSTKSTNPSWVSHTY